MYPGSGLSILSQNVQTESGHQRMQNALALQKDSKP